jgi:hypothetical protein
MEHLHLIFAFACFLALIHMEMKYTYSDKSYKRPSAKWWHVFNIVSCYDARGGLTPLTVYRVHTLRLWNVGLTQWSYVTTE